MEVKKVDKKKVQKVNKKEEIVEVEESK